MLSSQLRRSELLSKLCHCSCSSKGRQQLSKMWLSESWVTAAAAPNVCHCLTSCPLQWVFLNECKSWSDLSVEGKCTSVLDSNFVKLIINLSHNSVESVNYPPAELTVRNTLFYSLQLGDLAWLCSSCHLSHREDESLSSVLGSTEMKSPDHGERKQWDSFTDQSCPQHKACKEWQAELFLCLFSKKWIYGLVWPSVYGAELLSLIDIYFLSSYTFQTVQH